MDLICGRDRSGRARCWCNVYVRADALRRLGLHPDQPTAAPRGPAPPKWWHEAAEAVSRRRRR